MVEGSTVGGPPPEEPCRTKAAPRRGIKASITRKPLEGPPPDARVRRGRPHGLTQNALPALHAENHAQPAAARRYSSDGLILAPARIF